MPSGPASEAGLSTALILAGGPPDSWQAGVIGSK